MAHLIFFSKINTEKLTKGYFLLVFMCCYLGQHVSYAVVSWSSQLSLFFFAILRYFCLDVWVASEETFHCGYLTGPCFSFKYRLMQVHSSSTETFHQVTGLCICHLQRQADGFVFASCMLGERLTPDFELNVIQRHYKI